MPRRSGLPPPEGVYHSQRLPAGSYTLRGEHLGDGTAEVELIEVYRGLAQTPAEFAGYQARSGVVAVWTRRGF